MQMSWWGKRDRTSIDGNTSSTSHLPSNASSAPSPAALGLVPIKYLKTLELQQRQQKRRLQQQQQYSGAHLIEDGISIMTEDDADTITTATVAATATTGTETRTGAEIIPSTSISLLSTTPPAKFKIPRPPSTARGSSAAATTTGAAFHKKINTPATPLELILEPRRLFDQTLSTPTVASYTNNDSMSKSNKHDRENGSHVAVSSSSSLHPTLRSTQRSIGMQSPTTQSQDHQKGKQRQKHQTPSPELAFHQLNELLGKRRGVSSALSKTTTTADFVNDWKRTMLRAEGYNVSRAAQRCLHYWRYKADLFGVPDLQTTINDIEFLSAVTSSSSSATKLFSSSLRSSASSPPTFMSEYGKMGLCQLCPTRDLEHQRAIVTLQFIPSLYRSHERELKQYLFYMLSTALEDEDTQDNGLILLVWNDTATTASNGNSSEQQEYNYHLNAATNVARDALSFFSSPTTTGWLFDPFWSLWKSIRPVFRIAELHYVTITSNSRSSSNTDGKTNNNDGSNNKSDRMDAYSHTVEASTAAEPYSFQERYEDDYYNKSVSQNSNTNCKSAATTVTTIRQYTGSEQECLHGLLSQGGIPIHQLPIPVKDSQGSQYFQRWCEWRLRTEMMYRPPTLSRKSKQNKHNFDKNYQPKYILLPRRTDVLLGGYEYQRYRTKEEMSQLQSSSNTKRASSSAAATPPPKANIWYHHCLIEILPAYIQATTRKERRKICQQLYDQMVTMSGVGNDIASSAASFPPMSPFYPSTVHKDVKSNGNDNDSTMDNDGGSVSSVQPRWLVPIDEDFGILWEVLSKDLVLLRMGDALELLATKLAIKEEKQKKNGRHRQSRNTSKDGRHELSHWWIVPDCCFDPVGSVCNSGSRRGDRIKNGNGSISKSSPSALPTPMTTSTILETSKNRNMWG